MMLIGGEKDYSSLFLRNVRLSSLDPGMPVPDCLDDSLAPLQDYPYHIARGAAFVLGMNVRLKHMKSWNPSRWFTRLRGMERQHLFLDRQYYFTI